MSKSKPADEPLCPRCHEDKPGQVEATLIGGRPHWFCSTCGLAWTVETRH